jgi:N-acetyl sugar amidotransferase
MKKHHVTTSLPSDEPQTIVYCSRCVASNTRPQSRREHEVSPENNEPETLAVEGGLCDACKIDDAKKSVDWDARWNQLEELCDKHRSADGSFDCIVPGSGGKDSVFQAHLLKDELGMHPLTVTAPPTIPTPAGEANFAAWTNDYPNVMYRPPGDVHRLLTRLAFERLQHPFQPWVIMQQNIGPRAAKDFGIELVFYGEPFANHGAGSVAETQTSLRRRAVYTYENLDTLRFGGASIAELAEMGVSLSDLNLYMPVKDPGEVQVHFLGWFRDWTPREAELYALTRGFNPSPERISGGYQSGSSIDDLIDEAHYYAAYAKFGAGRASFQACQDIRAGVISRELGVELVRRFDSEYPQHIAEILDYLKMSKEQFDSIIDWCRPSRLFDEEGKLRHVA